MSLNSKKTINILGVTGSIGQATGDVICANPDMFEVNLITAHRDERGLDNAFDRLKAKCKTLTSHDKIAFDKSVDITVCAISGMAGLPSMMEAIAHSKAVAIANKEPLVAAGDLVIAHAKKHGTTLLPLDSEHNAIFQCLDKNQSQNIDKITVTGSGGPFRKWDKADIYNAPIDKALKHPNWSMGKKITIDSATLANKALEVIEAVRLFDLDYKKVEVVIHPQSIIHSLVTYQDGSTLAQLGNNDMCVPIAHALGFPNRIHSSVQPLNFQYLNDLTFEPVDHDKFPFVHLAYECLKAGQSACLIMNAANEIAVEAYLSGIIVFGKIYETVKEMLDHIAQEDLNSLSGVLDLDARVRSATSNKIQSYK